MTGPQGMGSLNPVLAPVYPSFDLLLSHSPVLLARFNDAAPLTTVLDHSGHNHHGQLINGGTGAPIFTAQGTVGPDGDSYLSLTRGVINFGDQPEFSGLAASGMTFVMVFKPTTVASQMFLYLKSPLGGGIGPYEYFSDHINSMVRWNGAGNHPYSETNAVLDTATWNVALFRLPPTSEVTRVRNYLNSITGKLHDTSNVSSFPTNTTAPLLVGMRASDNPGVQFTGSLAYFAVYDYTWPHAENVTIMQLALDEGWCVS